MFQNYIIGGNHHLLRIHFQNKNPVQLDFQNKNPFQLERVTVPNTKHSLDIKSRNHSLTADL